MLVFPTILYKAVCHADPFNPPCVMALLVAQPFLPYLREVIYENY